VSLVRVFSGTLRAEEPVHVTGHISSFFSTSTGNGHEDHDEDERIGSLSYVFGGFYVPATEVVAGDLCAIGKLSRAETGDSLSSIDQPRVLRPWSMPEPLLPVAIVAKSKADEDKLSQALGRLAAEDPSLRVENNPATHQLVLWCMGEAHADVLISRLAERYAVHVETEPFLVSLRETFGGTGQGLGRHVKQSGGHGQYAVCHLQVEPLPEGAGFEFVDKVVGGAVPRNFIPSVEKGVRAQMERGVRAGYPMVDLRVTLTDGKAHSVDSSDMAFQMAGGLALREAATGTSVTMLEPYDLVAVVVPDEHVGAAMSDLSSRRARLLGTDKLGDDRTVINAEVPQTELVRYAVDLRSATHGAGSFTRSFGHYEPMPEDVARHVTVRER
jgi:elongation factor G